MAGRSSQVDDECENEQTKNRDELDGGKAELCLSVDAHGKDVETQNEHNDDANPYSRIHAHASVLPGCPIAYNCGRGTHFCALSEG